MAGVKPDVILTVTDVIRCKEVYLGAAVPIRPVLHYVEHVAMQFAVLIAQGRVVEDTADVIEDFMKGDVGVLPREDDARGYVLEDRGGNLATGFVKDVGKVVFAEHAVGWVAALRISPRLVLVLAACVDYGGAASFELLRDGIDDRADEGGQEGEDEHGECFRDFLDESFEAGDFLDGCRDRSHYLVSELEDWIDLRGGLLRVEVCAHAWDARTRATGTGARRSSKSLRSP